MKIPERKDCEHSPVCKYEDCMCPTECGYFAERSDNSDYAVQPTASPKLPSLKEVSDYIGYMPDETMTIQSTYNVIKKLGNFA